MTSQQKKTKFRQSYKWKRLRNRLKEERVNDELTDEPLQPGWSLHHIDMNENHYFNITNEDNFMCLNRQTHEFLHWLLRHYKRNPEILDNLRAVCEKHKEINFPEPQD